MALRPLLADYTLAMKRGATIVYPKDAAQILAYADVFPGARVLEAGAGSGALSCWLLRAIGPDGELVSFEAAPRLRRDRQRRTSGSTSARSPRWWRLVTGELSAPVALDPSLRTSAAYARLRRRRARAWRAGRPGRARPRYGSRPGARFDRVILDMLAPWENVAARGARRSSPAG